MGVQAGDGPVHLGDGERGAADTRARLKREAEIDAGGRTVALLRNALPSNLILGGRGPQPRLSGGGGGAV